MKQKRTPLQFVLTTLLLGMMISLGMMTSATSTFAEEDVLPTETQSDPAYVSVYCELDAASALTWCTFTASNAAGAVESVVIPYAQLCSAVISSGASADADGWSGAGSGVTLGLEGAVYVSGGGSYLAGAVGALESAAGDGLACGVYPEPEPTVEPPPVEETPIPEPTDEVTAEPTEPTDPSEVPITPEATESESAASPTIVPTTDDGTGGNGDEGGAVSVAAERATILVTSYYCDDDPGAVDPVTAGCSAAGGIEVSATGGNAAPDDVDTDGNGEAEFAADVGEVVTIAERLADVDNDYDVLGNGVAQFTVEAGVNSVVFIHIDEEEMGRLQVINGSCPTSDEARTKWTIIDPNGVSTASEESCGPNEGAIFTVTGGELGGSGIDLITDDDGTWKGWLPAGDYTITNVYGRSVGFSVAEGDRTIIIAVDYLPGVKATLHFSHWYCSDGDVEGDSILFGKAPQVPVGSGCERVEGVTFIENNGGAGDPEAIAVPAEGDVSLPLALAMYDVSDMASGVRTTINITSADDYEVAVVFTERSGGVTASVVGCLDEGASSALLDGDGPCEESDEGIVVSLYDTNGAVVAAGTTDANGVVTWPQVKPGTYTLGYGDSICSASVDGQDATKGFLVASSELLVIEMLVCGPASSGGGVEPGGENPDSGAEAPGGGSEAPGGDVGVAAGEDIMASVVTLPNTGSGANQGHGKVWSLMLASSLFLLFGLTLKRGRMVQERRRAD